MLVYQRVCCYVLILQSANMLPIFWLPPMFVDAKIEYIQYISPRFWLGGHLTLGEGINICNVFILWSDVVGLLGHLAQQSFVSGSPAFDGAAAVGDPIPRWKRGGPVQPLHRFPCCGGSTAGWNWLWVAIGHYDWLVVWNMFHFSIYIYNNNNSNNWEYHHPNWRTPSFFRGVGQPPTWWFLADEKLGLSTFTSCNLKTPKNWAQAQEPKWS